MDIFSLIQSKLIQNKHEVCLYSNAGEDKEGEQILVLWKKNWALYIWQIVSGSLENVIPV